MPPTVKIYTLSTCSLCHATKKLLKECNVDFNFFDVDTYKGEEREAILDEFGKVNPYYSFPTIIIGKKVILGYKENEIKEALGSDGCKKTI